MLRLSALRKEGSSPSSMTFAPAAAAPPTTAASSLQQLELSLLPDIEANVAEAPTWLTPDEAERAFVALARLGIPVPPDLLEVGLTSGID